MCNLSIVTISFNQSEFLEECINSVVSQISEDDEYILVDPGSTDGSREIILSYGERIIKCFEKDSGPSDGLNKGFALGNNDYYYFLNSDDVLLPNSVNNIKKAIKSNPDVDVLCFGGYMTDVQLNKIKPMRMFDFSASRYLNGNTGIFQQGVVFKKSIFDKSNGFDLNNRTCWDARLFFDFDRLGAKFTDFEEKIALFRVYDGSITGSAENKQENSINVNNMFREEFGRDKNELDKFKFKVFRFLKYMHPSYLFDSIRLKVKRF
ncbi:glycosyl transferase [Vibrio sp. JCM 19236]|nr:glycosyl transferase [Vibrio sp. JCM 19236]